MKFRSFIRIEFRCLNRIKFYILLLPLIFWNCQRNLDKEIVYLNYDVDSDKFITVIDEIEISVNSDSDSTFRFFGANKIIEYDDTTLMVLDILKVSINFITNDGKYLRSIGAKGFGPGEFQSISDFTFDKNGNIYVLDSYGHKVGMFSKDGEFLKNFNLSFIHRMPYKILFFNDHMLVEGLNNLDEGSTIEEYKFLEYANNNFINVYDINFKYLGAFLHPTKELYDTKGIFSRPYMCFAVYTIIGNQIVAMTQEGFYKLQWFDLDLKKIRETFIVSKDFKEIELENIRDLSFNADRSVNFSNKKIGKIVGNHSVPVNIVYNDNYLIIQTRDPIENYYPNYAQNSIPKFRSDILLLDSNKLKPIVSFNNGQELLIGTGKNGVLYYSSSYSHQLNKIEKFIIKKVKITKEA